MSGRSPTPSSADLVGPVRHHRRIRRRVYGPSWLRVRGPLLLVGTGAAILTCVAGFAVGSLVLGSFSSSPPQSAAYGIPNAPPGVTFYQAELQFINGSTSPATGACAAGNIGNASSPTALTSGTATAICLSHQAGGYGAGDAVYTLEVNWTSAAANATVFKVNVAIDVTPATNDISVTSYVKTSPTITGQEEAVYSVDLIQSGDTSITQFAMLVTQL